MTTLDAFAAYVRGSALEAGYRIDRRRGQRALARAAGMTTEDVRTTLAGAHCPDPYEIERLAAALGLSLITLLLDSGLVPPRHQETP